MGWEQITHPDDRAEDLEKYEEFVSGDLNGYSLEKRYVRPDGTAVWVHMTLTALVLAESSQRNHICLVQDITRRKEMELALAESERSHSVLLAHLPGMAYRCRPDRNWTMLFVSEGCRELTGYEPESLLYNAKLSYNDLIVPESRERIWQEWQALLPERKIFQMQYEIVTASGERKWVWEMGQGIFEAQGKAEVLEGIILDISAQKKLEDDLLYITEHDPWTGLHNSLFLENLIFRDVKEQRIQGNALVSVNLSALQRVSMTYGFHYVQDLIRKTAQALESLCREDCRLFYASDNQFIFYLDDYRDREKLNQFCAAVKDVIKPLLATENIHAGIGVVEIALEDSVNGEQLLRNLLIASEMAISDGDEDVGVRFYDRAMEVRLVREEDIKNELTLSVINPESKQLILEFQPILDLHTERICGFEALARLHSDRLGRIPPLDFIPIAERTRLIVPLGEKILWQAFAFLKRLDREGHTDISVSVNISVIQLLRQDFAERLLAIIQQAGVNPDRVGLEITESVFVAGYQEINRMLGALQTQGIRIALDDFGTGYSSLAREREMNIDCLKIDKSFIDNLMVLKDDEAITGDIVSMAHKLGHCVVAEGVEHERQREYLLRCGCDRIQGYLISRPVAADAALALLQKEKA